MTDKTDDRAVNAAKARQADIEARLEATRKREDELDIARSDFMAAAARAIGAREARIQGLTDYGRNPYVAGRKQEGWAHFDALWVDERKAWIAAGTAAAKLDLLDNEHRRLAVAAGERP